MKKAICYFMIQHFYWNPNKLLTLKHGVSLTEKSCGSNAVSLTLQLRESIYFEPRIIIVTYLVNGIALLYR